MTEPVLSAARSITENHGPTAALEAALEAALTAVGGTPAQIRTAVETASLHLRAYESRAADADRMRRDWVQMRDHAEALAAALATTEENIAQRVARDAEGKHIYLSTSCLHDDHEYCQRTTGHMGLKEPTECKFCNRKCICTCHTEETT